MSKKLPYAERVSRMRKLQNELDKEVKAGKEKKNETKKSK